MHSKQCLAASIIAAVENLRDMEGQTSFDFRIAVQENTPLEWADLYLKDGTMTCTCGEYAVEDLYAQYVRATDAGDTEAVDSVQFEASLALSRKTISPEQYLALARRCHNRADAERIRRNSPDSKPLPENVGGHAMWGPHEHEDGRVCFYHQRLGMWVLNDTTQCLRSDHPTLAAMMRRKS